jgi:hypothetical protein
VVRSQEYGRVIVYLPSVNQSLSTYNITSTRHSGTDVRNCLNVLQQRKEKCLLFRINLRQIGRIAMNLVTNVHDSALCLTASNETDLAQITQTRLIYPTSRGHYFHDAVHYLVNMLY